MPKYNIFVAKTSDGKHSIECRTVSQAKKFLPDWLLKTEHGKVVRRLDADDEPVIGAIEHVQSEIDEEEIAKKRGLTTVKDGGAVQPVRQYVMVEGADGWELTDVREAEKAMYAAAAKDDADDEKTGE